MKSNEDTIVRSFEIVEIKMFRYLFDMFLFFFSQAGYIVIA